MGPNSQQVVSNARGGTRVQSERRSGSGEEKNSPELSIDPAVPKELLSTWKSA